MTETLQLSDEFSAYHVKPASTLRGSLVVLQEIFGVNQHIREVCEHWAELGFETLAPALFDPIRKNVELGYTPEDFPKGRELITKLGWDKALEGTQLAVDFLHQRGQEHVSVMGFCWGGSLAFLAACRLKGIDKAVCYYGRAINDFLNEKPRVPVIFHYGQHDHGIPPQAVEQVRVALGNRYGIYVYDAGHGFNCDHRADYDEASARLAERRTLEFLD